MIHTMIKVTRSRFLAPKPSASPFPLQPTGAPSNRTQPLQLHPFQTLRCQGLANTCSHQRHWLLVPSAALEAEPAS